MRALVVCLYLKVEHISDGRMRKRNLSRCSAIECHDEDAIDLKYEKGGANKQFFY